jgi:hypothetical protein
MTFNQTFRLTVVVTALTCMHTANATLGADAASVSADAAALSGSIRAESGTSVFTVDVDNGIHVREWLDAAGLVYAVSWSGPAQPNLSQLLGPYYSQFEAAATALPTPGRHRVVRVQAADLVVETEGYLRAYSGRAYLTAHVPAGVSLAGIH